MTLTEFLLARIAEDEAVANRAHRESMRGHAGPGFARSLVAWQHQAKDVRGGELIARMTPARVLAECEAKRRIVEVLTHVAAQCPVDQWNPSDTALIEVLGVMAEVYADHPDFQDDWKP